MWLLSLRACAPNVPHLPQRRSSNPLAPSPPAFPSPTAMWMSLSATQTVELVSVTSSLSYSFPSLGRICPAVRYFHQLTTILKSEAWVTSVIAVATTHIPVIKLTAACAAGKNGSMKIDITFQSPAHRSVSARVCVCRCLCVMNAVALLYPCQSAGVTVPLPCRWPCCPPCHHLLLSSLP